MLFENLSNDKNFMHFYAFNGKEVFLSIENYGSFVSSLNFLNPSKLVPRAALKASKLLYPFIKYFWRNKSSLSLKGKNFIKEISKKALNLSRFDNQYAPLAAIRSNPKGLERYAIKLGDDSKNFYVLKISKDKKVVLREKKALEALEKLSCPFLLIPKIVNVGQYEDYAYLISESMSGVLKISPKKFDKKIFLALLLINRFNLNFNKEKKLLVLKKFFGYARKLYATSCINQREFELIVKNIRHLKKIDFPLVYCHGDFAPYNIMKKGDKVAVFDFEYANNRELPALDLFHFIFQNAFLVNKIKIDYFAFKNLLSKNRLWIDDYFKRIGIDDGLKQSFLIMYFLSYAYRAITDKWGERTKNNFLDSLKLSLKINFFRNQKTFDFGYLSFDKITIKNSEKIIAKAILKKKKIYINELNVNSLKNCFFDRNLINIYNSATLKLTDGMPIKIISTIFNSPIPERICGPDMIEKIFELSAKKNYSIFLLGSSEKVLQKIKERAFLKFGKINFVGEYSPSYVDEFDKTENEAIVDLINEAKPDILLVSLSSPKQEKWIYDNFHKINAIVSIGLGAAFDIFAGIFPRAPLWMQRVSLEWLWRLSLEPKRLFKRYFMGFFILSWLFAKEAFIYLKNLK